MAKVTLTGNLRLYTAGITEVEIEASNIRELLKNLGREYPNLAAQLPMISPSQSMEKFTKMIGSHPLVQTVRFT